MQSKRFFVWSRRTSFGAVQRTGFFAWDKYLPISVRALGRVAFMRMNVMCPHVSAPLEAGWFDLRVSNAPRDRSLYFLAMSFRMARRWFSQACGEDDAVASSHADFADRGTELGCTRTIMVAVRRSRPLRDNKTIRARAIIHGAGWR